MVSNCSVLFFLAECLLGKVSERFNKKRPNKVKTVRIDAKQNTGSGAFFYVMMVGQHRSFLLPLEPFVNSTTQTLQIPTQVTWVKCLMPLCISD